MVTTRILLEAQHDLADVRTGILALIEWHQGHCLKPDEEKAALLGFVGELRAIADSISCIPEACSLQLGT